MVCVLSNHISDLSVGLAEHVFGFYGLNVAFISGNVSSFLLGELFFWLLKDMSGDVSRVAGDDVGVVISI
jgi:hypothetical protein